MCNAGSEIKVGAWLRGYARIFSGAEKSALLYV